MAAAEQQFLDVVLAADEERRAVQEQKEALEIENAQLKHKLSLLPSEPCLSESPITYSELEAKVARLETEVVERDSEASKILTLSFENKLNKERNKVLTQRLEELRKEEEKTKSLEEVAKQLQMENLKLKEEKEGKEKVMLIEVLREQLETMKERVENNRAPSFYPNLDEYRIRYESKSKEVEDLQTQLVADRGTLEEARRELFSERAGHAETKKAILPTIKALEEMVSSDFALKVRCKIPDNEIRGCLEACKDMKTELEEMKAIVVRETQETKDSLQNQFEKIFEAAKQIKGSSDGLSDLLSSAELIELRCRNVELKYCLENERRAVKQLKKRSERLFTGIVSSARAAVITKEAQAAVQSS